MALRHRELPAEGVQFHPESVLTEEGKLLLKNFLDGPERVDPSASEVERGLRGIRDAMASPSAGGE